MLSSIVDRFMEVNDAQIQHYSVWILTVAMTYYVATSFHSAVPADASYAIAAHLPQGIDRSLIAARIEQRHLRQLFMKHLPFTKLRERLRFQTDRQEKLSLWSETFRLTLASILAASYAHSLTITLFTLKNTVRVLIFLLRRREEEVQQRKNRPGALGKLKAWWTSGTKSFMMQEFARRMSSQLEKQASPFINAGFDEEQARSTPPFYTQQVSQQQPPFANTDVQLADNPEDGIAQNMEWPSVSRSGHGRRDFSVRDIMEVATPRIIKRALDVVNRALDRRPSHAFSVTSIVTTEDLRELFNELCFEMESGARITAWVHLPPLPSPVTGARHCEDGDTRGDFPRNADVFALSSHSDVDGGDSVLVFPAGSTAVLGPDGRPIYSHTNDRNVPNEWDDFTEPIEVSGPHHEEIKQSFSLSVIPAASEVARHAQQEVVRREQVTRAQSAGFFQELLHSSSVAELCRQYAMETLEKVVDEVLDSLHEVKSYDVATDSVKMLMFIAALEAPRQQLYNAEFEVKSYLKLFCEEIVRSTCS